MQGLLKLIGRVLLSLIFILSGISKITAFGGVAQMMAARGVPASRLALAAVLVIEIAAGLMLLTGMGARLAALVLFLYLIPVTLVMHGYWRYPAEQRQGQQTQMLKNAAIMGGLLYVFASGPGPGARRLRRS